MLVTYLHAAGIAGVTKGAIRKAVAAGKLTATKDEQGRWLVHAGDVQRVWPRAPECGDQRVPVPDRDQAPVIAELRARLEAETRARETAEAHVRDLLRRLDQADEERRALTQRLLGPPASPAPSIRPWWRRWTW